MNLPKIDQSDPLKRYLSGMSSSSSISPMANSTSSVLNKNLSTPKPVTPANTSATATASPAFSGNLNLKTPGFAPKPAVTQTPAAQSYISSLGTKAEITPEQMRAGEAFTAQANAQPQQSTSAATPAPVTAPAISQNDTRKAYIQYLTGLGKEAQKYATPSQEEQDVATQLRQQTQMERQGLEDLKGQGRGIPLSVLGRQGTKIERDSALQKLALSENLQALTAQRTAQLDAANAAVKNGQLLKFGTDYVDPNTGDVVYSEPKEGDAGFTLGEGQVRYDAQGNKIAEGAAKSQSISEQFGSGSIGEYNFAKSQGYKGSFADYQNEDANRKATAAGGAGDKVLSVTEAQALGVPYGTTQSQALGLSVSGKPTAEQSKARQFAVSAENANNILDTLGYNIGNVEVPLPNAFKGEDRQKFEQAARAFVNSVLRRESGATITDDEFQNKKKELIDQPGDSAGVKAQKKLARAAAVKSVQEAGGSGTSTNTSGSNDPLGIR